MTRTLVVHDADRIHDYIFSTGVLKEIRGASALVDSLTTASAYGVGKSMTKLAELLERFPDADLVYAGGGNVTAYFDDPGRAQEFVRKHARNVYQHTRAASSSGYAHTSNQPYLDAFQEAQTYLQDVKGRAEGAVFLEGGGLVRRCASCGLMAAECVDTTPDQTEQRICGACLRKRDEAEKRLPRIYDTLFPNTPKKHVIRHLPNDFNEIGAASSPPGYIAVIYADGDNIGQTIARLGEGKAEDEQEDEFRRFSKKLDDITREAAKSVFDGIYPHPISRRKTGGDYYPYQVIFCGGDDLVAVVPASDGLEVASGYIQEFAKRGVGIAPNIDITTSAGVVIAHDSHPFRELVALAKELLKSAKERRKTAGDQGCLDVMVLKASSSEELERERKRAYPYQSQKKPVGAQTVPWIQVAPGPMTVEELRRYQESAIDLARVGFPNSKLQELGGEVTSGFLRGTLIYYDMYTRQPRRRAVLDAIAARFDLNEGPWRTEWLEAGNRSTPVTKRSTPYAILADLYPFLKGAGR